MNKKIKDIASKVLEQIKEIKPKPKWYFTLKNEGLWSLWAISIFVGAISISAMFFSFSNFGWGFRMVTYNNLFDFILNTLPFVWIIILITFVYFAYKNIKETKKGYKYPISIILSISILLSLLVGAIFYYIGAGQIFDEKIGVHLPLHRPALFMQKKMWVNPEKGLIAGQVLNINQDLNFFILKSFDDLEWEILTEDLNEKDLEILSIFPSVRIIGVPMEKNKIHACLIFPWEVKKGVFRDSDFKYGKPLMLKMKQEILKGERNIFEERSIKCKGVRPYELLKDNR